MREQDLMRLALISDMHGNDVAFEAVVLDAARVGVDGWVCLGDAVQGGPQPRETLDRLRQLDCPVVLGNADEFLLRVPAEAREPITQQHLAVRDWTLSQLGVADVEFLHSLPPTGEVTLGGDGQLLAFHGSPGSNEDVLLPWSDEDALEPYGGHDAAVLAGGHTHLQWVRRIGGALYLNPGSVGVPYDHHRLDEGPLLAPVAEYALLNADARGLSAEFRRVPFSLEHTLQATRRSGMPGTADAADRWRALPR